MDRSYLKRPDRGVPPPRSGSPRLAVAIATYKSHELLEQCLASMAEHLPELLTQGRRIPGTDVVIISPEKFIAADPDCVLLTLPDLYEEVRQSYPQPDERWPVDPGALP